MVEVNKEDFDKPTVPQQMFIYRLLQSSTITKQEFEKFHRFVIPNFKRTADASDLINSLLTTIQLRKRFFPKNHRAHLKCCVCGSKKNVKRYYSPQINKQIVYCGDCDSFADRFDVDEQQFQAEQKAKLEKVEIENKKKQEIITEFNCYVDEENGKDGFGEIIPESIEAERQENFCN